MVRVSSGEISKIAEFSTALALWLLADGRNLNFSQADRNRCLLIFKLLIRDSRVREIESELSELVRNEQP